MIQKIGEGWFSRVYLTEHRQTHQEVVLKAVAIDQRKCCNSYDSDSCNDEVPDDAEADSLFQINPQLREGFLREYRNAYRLSTHGNILTVYDVIFEVGFLHHVRGAPMVQILLSPPMTMSTIHLFLLLNNVRTFYKS